MDLVQRAHELYCGGRMHDAMEAAQAACDRAPKDPEAWRLLARVSRHIGLTVASDDAFRRAAALTGGHPLPFRVTTDRFQELLKEARGGLRAGASQRLASMTVRVQPLPTLDEVRSGVDPDALSARRGQGQDVVAIYQVNHENRSATEQELLTLIGRSLGRA
jgi:Tetratricopeptide repeat